MLDSLRMTYPMTPSKTATGSVAQAVTKAAKVTRNFWIPPMAQLLRDVRAALGTDSALNWSNKDAWKLSATGALVIDAYGRLTVTDSLEKAENMRQPLLFALREWEQEAGRAGDHLIAGALRYLELKNYKLLAELLEADGISDKETDVLLEICVSQPRFVKNRGMWTLANGEALEEKTNDLISLLNEHEWRTLLFKIDRMLDQDVTRAYLDRTFRFLNGDLGLAEQFQFTQQETMAILQSVHDKIAFGDYWLNGVKALTEPVLVCHLYHMMAESLTQQRLAEILQKTSDGLRLELLASAFSQKPPYDGLREGGYRITQILIDRAPKKIADLAKDLKTGWFDAEWCFKAVFEEKRAADALGPLAEQQLIFNAGELVKRLKAAAARVPDTDLPWGDKLQAKENLQRGLLKMLRTAVDWFAKADQDKACQEFVKVFGIRLFGYPEFKEPPNDLKSAIDWAQLFAQVHTLTVDPKRYLTGLKRIVMALPTAGKPLEEFTYLPTLAENLVTVLETALGKPPETDDLAKHPILVFDQNKPTIYNANTTYLTELSRKTKARFVQVSMQHALKIAATLKIKDYFDASGDGNAGYGGCRNIVFLLGPMLFAALRDNLAVSADTFADLPESSLKLLLKKVLDNKDCLMVLMGDDDTTLLPGFLHAKSLLASCEPEPQPVEYPVQLTGSNGIQPRVPCYAKISQRTGGRFTLAFPPTPIRYYTLHTDDRETYEEMIFRGMGAACWDPGEMWHEMAGVLCHLGACLPLTWPTEEEHFSVFEKLRDSLAYSIHHPGDRYKVVSARFLDMANYCLDASFVQDLYWKQSGKKEPRVMPWNDKGPETAFEELYEVFQFVVRKEADIAIAFWKRLEAIFPQFPKGEDYFGWEEGRTPKAVFDSLRNRLFQEEWKQHMRRESAPRLRREFNELERGYTTFMGLYEAMMKFRKKLLETGGPSRITARAELLKAIQECANGENVGPANRPANGLLRAALCFSGGISGMMLTLLKLTELEEQ